MNKYNHIVVAGLVWASQSFCGLADPTEFLNAVKPVKVVTSAVINEQCELELRKAGQPARLGDDVFTTLYVQIPASQTTTEEDGSVVINPQ